ncbi:hypothetical protein EV368DRAFT_82281 [Lentinula lateritia]|nr:hypothetical protein EV368DRAFT_82281 [Lentinula lateritia]
MDFSSVGNSYADVIHRIRKFRAFDEPEKKHIFQSFTEFCSPYKPPATLGKPGDVFLNRKTFKLYMREDSQWTQWHSTSDSSRLKYPELQNRFLWIVPNSGQRMVDFVPSSILQRFKILDATELLKSIVSLQQKQDLTRKRKSESSLNTKKGKKGRLSNIEPPVGWSGIDDPPTQPLTSMSAPIPRSNLTSSLSFISPLQTPGSSSSRVSLHTSISMSPQIRRDRKLLERNELLERENQELKMSLRISKELEKDSHMASSMTESTGREESGDGTLSIDENDTRRPQLQSPPPTPSILGNSSNEFMNRDMHHNEPLFPSTESESSSRDAGVEEAVDDIPDVAGDKKPSIQVKLEPQRTAATPHTQPEYIDLTLDSDDDQPSTSFQPVSKSLCTVSSTSCEAPCLQLTSNNPITTLNSKQTPKHIASATPSNSASPNRKGQSSNSGRNRTSTSISHSSQIPVASPIRVGSRPSTPKSTPTPTVFIKRSSVTSIPREASSIPTQDDDDDDDEIFEISLDQFRAAVKAGKKKAREEGPIPDLSNAQPRSQNKVQIPVVKAEPANQFIVNSGELLNDLAQSPEASPDDAPAAAMDVLGECSDDGHETLVIDPDAMADSEDYDFDLAYPENEHQSPPPPPPSRDADIKMEVVDAEFAHKIPDVNMGNVEMERDVPNNEGEENQEEGEEEEDLIANLGLTLDALRVSFRGKKGYKRCKICSALRLKERKIKFPISDPRSMLHHLATSHREQVLNLQNKINEFGLDSEQLRAHREDDDV